MPERAYSPERVPTTDQHDHSTTELRDSKSTISSYKTALASPSLVSPSAAYGPFTPTKLFTHDSSENLLSLREALAMKSEGEATDDSTQHRDDKAEDRDLAVAVFNKIGECWGGGIQNGHKAGNSEASAVADDERDWNEHDISTAGQIDSDYLPTSLTHTHRLDEPIEDYFPASSSSSSTLKPSAVGYNKCRCAHDRASEVLLVGISGAPAHGRKIMLDILRAVFSVTEVVTQDEYALAPQELAAWETRPSVITKGGEEPLPVAAVRYNFDIEKLTRRLTNIKAGENHTAASHNPEDQIDDQNTTNTTPHNSDKAALISTLRTLSLTLGTTAHDRIAIVEGPYLYSSPLISSLIDVRLQLLERKFLQWEDSVGTWYLRDDSSSSEAGWGRQVLETAVWRDTPNDYDMKLRTADDLKRDLGVEGPPVPVYESAAERLMEWGVRCVAERMGRRKLQMISEMEAREAKGLGTRQRDRRERELTDTEGAGRGCWGRFMKWSCFLVGAGVVSRVLAGKLWRR
jgi:hypothetical protein